MAKNLQGKVIIITGASSGIGFALAEICLSMDMKVVLAARTVEPLHSLVEVNDNYKERSLILATDISREEDCKALIEKTVNKFHKIDILINNAGISMRALFSELETNILKKVMDVNFWGSVYCTKYSLPYLHKSKGSVVGVSSIAGYKGLPARTGYSASKFALQGFLESLRIENMKNGLHVLIACPGFTASAIRSKALNKYGNPQGESPRNENKMMKASTVAKLIIKAIENKKHTLILTRQGKLLVWLNKFFPKMMDKITYNHIAKEPDSPFK